MRVGVLISPVVEWPAVADAAQAADELGFDAVGLWDHYHSAKPEWGYVAGWAAWGALAALTSRVRLVPMVLNNLHHQLGRLAKEATTLSLISNGRFELALGGGDWRESFEAWGERYPPSDERLARLADALQVLPGLLAGEQLTLDSRFATLREACVAPPANSPPRLIAGVGKSIRMASAVVGYVDELNIYADTDVLAATRALAAGAARPVDISVFFSWEWDKWPADPRAELEQWRERGVDRVFISLGGSDMRRRLELLEPLLGN